MKIGQGTSGNVIHATATPYAYMNTNQCATGSCILHIKCNHFHFQCERVSVRVCVCVGTLKIAPDIWHCPHMKWTLKTVIKFKLHLPIFNMYNNFRKAKIYLIIKLLLLQSAENRIFATENYMT